MSDSFSGIAWQSLEPISSGMGVAVTVLVESSSRLGVKTALSRLLASTASSAL